MMNDIALFFSRTALGASIAAHGAQKAFGWFEGPGPDGAAGFMASLGFTPGPTYAKAAAYSEIAAGTLMTLGLGGSIGPAILISTMIVAQTTVHAKNGYFAQKNGIELGTIYSAGALAFAGGDFGAISLDRAFGLDEKVNGHWFTALVLAGGVGAAYALLAQRQLPEPKPPAQPETT